MHPYEHQTRVTQVLVQVFTRWQGATRAFCMMQPLQACMLVSRLVLPLKHNHVCIVRALSYGKPEETVMDVSLQAQDPSQRNLSD